MLEQAVRIPGSPELAATLHVPAGVGPFPAIACFHGLSLTQGQFTVPARRFAAAGIAVLRVDLGGHGQSEGDLEGTILARLLEEARRVVRWLGAQTEVDPKRLGVLGFSMGGGCAALLTADPSLGLRALALWAPLLDTAEWASRRRETCEPLGNGRYRIWEDKIVREELFLQAPQMDPESAARNFAGPLLVAHPLRDRNMPQAMSRRMAEARKREGKPTSTLWVERSGHLFEVPEEKETLYRVTQEFFLESLK
jgi:dienelactone hydrolase